MTDACFPGCYPMDASSASPGPQCVGPRTTPTTGYNNSCANGALATARAWINACDTYQSPGTPGNPIDPRCIGNSKCSGGVLPYDKTFCQKRCPVAVGLAHKESLYCPTAISPDWNSQTHYCISNTHCNTIVDKPGNTEGCNNNIECWDMSATHKPFSDGLGIDYGGGYGLWQLDGRNQNVQKLFVEQIENNCGDTNDAKDISTSVITGCWYKEGFDEDPTWGYVAGFLTPKRQKEFVDISSVGRELLTPVKQAEWTLYQTSGDFGGGRPIKLPGCDWSELRTCAGGPDSPEIWDASDSNPDGSPAHIAATTGVEVCTQAMHDYHQEVDISNDWFLYEHCINDTGTIGDKCLDYKNISDNG
jgi:hypothetical protein